MEDDKQVVTEEATTETTTQEAPTSDNTVEEILEYRDSTREAEDESEPTAEETKQTEPSGEDVKTQEKEDVTPDQTSVDDKVEEAIPYQRFKEVNETLNDLKPKYEEQQKELTEARSLFQDPTVFEAVLRAKGITDETVIDRYFQENGMVRQKPQEYDLNTENGWVQKMQSIASGATQEVRDELAKLKVAKEDAERQGWIKSQTSEATTLAKDNYGLEFGTAGKDEGNPDTGVGKIAGYLRKNPEDAKLGHVKLLKLAIADEGFKGAVVKGVEKEKKRQTTVKAAAMEEAQTQTIEEKPGSDWSVERIMEWRETHS